MACKRAALIPRPTHRSAVHALSVEGHTFLGDFLSKQSVVIDLGANHGAFTKQLWRRFGCRCICVEANPRLCEELERVGAERVIFGAVYGASKPLVLRIDRNSECSTVLMHEQIGSHGTANV